MHRLIFRAAILSAHLFAWVFVFQYFYTFSRSVSAALGSVLFTYALSQVVVVLLTPIAARRLRHGFRRSLVAAVAAFAASCAILATAFSGDLGDIGLGVALFALLSGIYRALYWIPYEIAKEIAPTPARTWSEVAVALVPLIAGLSLTAGPTSSIRLLFFAGILGLLSLIPLLRLSEAYEGFAWKYRQTFHELFDVRHRALLWSTIWAGIEGAALFILWPIAVFTLVDWSYPLLGAVLTLTLLFTLIARQLFHGAILSVPARVQPVIAASGWVMRLGATGFVGAVLIDTYFHTASRSQARGLDIRSYEQAADNSTFVDEYTALKEMGMALGRIILCLFTATLLGVMALAHALALSFVIAAIAAGLSVYYAQKERSVY